MDLSQTTSLAPGEEDAGCRNGSAKHQVLAALATGAVPSTQAGAAAADAWAPCRIRQRITGSSQQATGSGPKPPDREGRRPEPDLLEPGTEGSTEVAYAGWGGKSDRGEVSVFRVTNL